MVTGSRLRQIGWIMILLTCMLGLLALTFKVNAVKSDVRLAERQIVRLERDKLLFETEFQTLANQRQLADWNRIEFGYRAPLAEQYLDGRRQLASLGQPRATNAPDPIRMARAETSVVAGEGDFPAFLSPLTGKPASGAEASAEGEASEASSPDGPAPDGSTTGDQNEMRSLAERLAETSDFSDYMSGSGE